jgi:hypothetical protein
VLAQSTGAPSNALSLFSVPLLLSSPLSSLFSPLSRSAPRGLRDRGYEDDALLFTFYSLLSLALRLV